MRLLIDLLPWLFFAVTFWITQDIIIATVVLLPATLLQLAISWFMFRSIEKMHLITLAAVIIFGGATLLFQESRFIQWKPTVVNLLFALIFFFSHFIGEKKPVLHRLLGSKLELPSSAWLRLSYAWIVFFIISALVNIYVAYTFSEAAWVNFKLFGQLAITFTFVLGQSLYIYTVMQKTAKPAAQEE